MSVENFFEYLKLDELYWFVGEESHTETRENTYIMTMVSREPRQIMDLMWHLISLRSVSNKL